MKHSGGGGFGKLMKQAAPETTVMTGGLAGALGGSTTGQVAGVAMSAQQAAMSQLSGVSQQIKNKDDVTFGYEMLQTGQDKPRIMETTLKGKAKTDGEDVLTPMIQQAANAILRGSIKKQ